ncbi:cbb3-type cytochrome c oxidase subunit I [Halorubellus salinus]|uniref:cbb3-type cytochrome c oxidase subunit I n=1 Tax=Halorubellus salinus TaxID=755309 RepID=UPI001D07279B|nr:cbb3-type cytochrome c oxidase subunit I [Halorubellus salinus]
MGLSGELALTLLTGVLVLIVFALATRFDDWRTYTPLAGGGALGGETGYGHDEKPGGIVRWLTTVDHKDIGILYGVYAIVAFAWGGLAVMLMRFELATPAMDVLASVGGRAFYNQLLTSHGITMLFLFGTPILAAFSNYFIPLLIGADDMAFPRINAIAFWLLPPGAILIWAGFFLAPFFDGIAASMTSWTMYPPQAVAQTAAGQDAMSYEYAGRVIASSEIDTAALNAGTDLMLLGLHLTGVSATMGAINFIATIFTERGSDVGWDKLDIFSWTILTQSALILFSFPLLGSAIVMLLLDRNFATGFFAVEGGGTILYQHLFWFFGHPEVYILVLPPMGIISYVLPRFSGRKLFGFKFVVYSTLAIGVLSFGVWAHHMFASGIDPRLRAGFMAVSLAIAIPSAVKTFNWITTMWNGNIRLTTPMLFCIGFIANFIIGGVTGVFLAAVPVDLILHDTYYVVGHFHYVIMGAIAFAVFAGVYYWFPIVSGRMYQRTLGKAHFWTTMVGTNLTFFAMILLGYGGMPRRYATYNGVTAEGIIGYFTNLHVIATVGAFILLVGQIIWLVNMVQSWLEGPVVGPDPWNLKEDGLPSREFDWHADRIETTLADGGEPAEDEPMTDGGEPVDADDDAAGDE